jgi:hypothetical protein
MPKLLQKVTVEIFQNDQGQQTASVSGPAGSYGTLDPIVCSRVLISGLDTLTALQLKQRMETQDKPQIVIPDMKVVAR